MWTGDYKFVISNLILKDFKIRYRNMSLGVFWSLLNPLVMMSVLTIVFTKFFASPSPAFPLFLLCGLVPFNFFSMAWSVGTMSVTDNAGLVKRVPVPREILPVAGVLSVFTHILFQIALLVCLAFVFGRFPSVQWMWIPVIWLFLVVFAVGLSLLCSGINVYIRDTRYVVESVNTVLFWFVPIFYPLTIIPAKYQDLYLLNPVAAAVVANRAVILDGSAPSLSLLGTLALVSVITLALGWFVFQQMKLRFYNHL